MACDRLLSVSRMRMRLDVDAVLAYRLGWNAIPFARELLLSNCSSNVNALPPR